MIPAPNLKICPHLSTFVTIKKQAPNGTVVEVVEPVYAPCVRERCHFWEPNAPTIHFTKQGEVGECTKKLADFSAINNASINAEIAAMIDSFIADEDEETDETEAEESEEPKQDVNDNK